MANNSGEHLHRQVIPSGSKPYYPPRMPQQQQQQRRSGQLNASAAPYVKAGKAKSDSKSGSNVRESSGPNAGNISDKDAKEERRVFDLHGRSVASQTQHMASKSYNNRRPPENDNRYDASYDRRNSSSRSYQDRNKGSYGKSRAKYGQKGGSTTKPDLAQNRFRFYISPASPLCRVPISTILALSSADLWPHTVAVSALDFDPICSICLDSVNAGRALACGHLFCAVCIHRCLIAAESDPMLQKCPVCQEGELSSTVLKRCETRRESSKSQTFTLVHTMSVLTVDVPMPSADDLDALSCRFVIATGEAMMDIIEKERLEVIACRDDLTRFRDSYGLQIAQRLEVDVDGAHVEWYRQVGKTTKRSLTARSNTAPTANAVGLSSVSSSSQEDGKQSWFYQRSDGSLDFLHPMHLRCLAHSVKDESELPLKIKPNKVVEVEDWSDRQSKLMAVFKIGQCHLPEYPLSCRLFEVDLAGEYVTPEALSFVEKEAKDRARRRDDRERRKIKLHIEQMRQEFDDEERRRKAREDEENMIRAFFGFEKKRAEDELIEAQNRPQPAVHSFSAVVSSMGHFPALNQTSPKLQPATEGLAKSPISNTAASPLLEPLRSAWGTSSTVSSQGSSSFSLSSPPPDVSFAMAAVQGPGKKKALWQNNPGRRANW